VFSSDALCVVSSDAMHDPYIMISILMLRQIVLNNCGNNLNKICSPDNGRVRQQFFIEKLSHEGKIITSSHIANVMNFYFCDVGLI